MLNFQQQKRQIYLVSEPNYRTINFSTKKLLAIEMRKTQILINKSLDLRLSILDLSKAVMYELWSDYVKPNMMKMQNFVIWVQTALLCM